MKTLFPVLLALSVTVFGCETPPEARTADSIALAEDFVGHAPSGIRFPESLAGFLRGEVRTYGDSANMSFGYDGLSLRGPITLTFYVYPAPAMVSIGSPDDVVESARRRQLDLEFESCAEDVVEKYPSVELVSEHVGAIPFCGLELPGRAARYRLSTGGRTDPVWLSSLTVLRNGRWWIKVRATYLEAGSRRSEEHVAAAIEALDEANRPAE